jgi:hypothetical protein
MGNPLVAYNAKVAIGGTKINGLGTFTLSLGTTEDIDTTQFGDTYREYQDGLKEGGDFSYDGWLDIADTNGQIAIMNAQRDNTSLTDLRFYVNASSYWAPNKTGNQSDSYCKIRNVSMTADQGDAVRVSMSGRVSGRMTLV